ncbi:MAG: hypothetical protein HBSAPP03_12350 [Phycisphaerae bacterium]|nr:MAG: hypothetical protein HBSAPP03_12350 [Phycisphaerae bacterium]
MVLACLVLTACNSSTPLDAAAGVAVSPAGGRKAAAFQIAADWKAKTYTFDEAMNLAWEWLDSARNGTPMLSAGVVVKSTDATAFAGAVLDAMQICEGQFPVHDEMVLFWYRVGGLANKAAEEAHFAGRLAEAATLVEAGPRQWRTEGYWYTHPNHDGLAAAILAQSGRRSEAIARLQSRVELKGAAAEVYEMLMKGP